MQDRISDETFLSGDPCLSRISKAFAGQIYRTSPYKLGHSFSLGALCLAQVLIVVKMFYIGWWNTRKEKIARGEIADTRRYKTGDSELDFKYHL